MPFIKKQTSAGKQDNIILLGTTETPFSEYGLNKDEIDFINKKFADEQHQVIINKYDYWIFIQLQDEKIKEPFRIKEFFRKQGSKLHRFIDQEKISGVTIINTFNTVDYCLSFTEGLALSSYRFVKYYKEADKKRSPLREIRLMDPLVDEQTISELNNLLQAVFYARDLINEPISYLNAPRLAEKIAAMGKEAGYQTETFNKKKIESLKMGGLLAVNQGSTDPPTFSVLSWQPANAINKKPIVLVGKGIVYDTGGLSLKPTPNSMDHMKSDMGGAAVVAGIFYAVALAKLPVNIIGLVPATDNRPNGNAYAPGDVITMYDGTTVEVLNTDAEGRMILADALAFAKQYNPGLVIDFATLTGAADYAIDKYGIVTMGNADDAWMNKLKQSGDNVYERIVEFPFWEEYGEQLKSDIADLKNIGGKKAGAITAGKFLEHFTDYPYIHLDIAGTAYLHENYNYHHKGGTGIGIRLLFDLLKNNIKNQKV
jgi:leucyl aminopeptidase